MVPEVLRGARSFVQTGLAAHPAVVRSGGLARRALAGHYVVGVTRLWDASNGELVYEWKGHDCAVTQVVFSSDGKQLATSEVMVWPGSGTPTADRRDAARWQGDGEGSLCFRPGTADRLLTGGADCSLRLDVGSGRGDPALAKTR